MTVSVIIPVHNGGAAFDQCLEGLAKADPAPDEIIVVADGESDGAYRRAEALDARILKNDRPHGPAHARNRGAEAATSDVLFFLDADVVCHPDVVAQVKAAFAEDPSLDALIGSYDDTPGHPSFLSQYRNLLHHYVHQHSDEDASTFWGACAAIRKRVFLEVGGFDESYGRPSIEDIELGYRLKAAGHRIALRKTLLVTHLKQWTAASIIRTDLFQRALPWTDLLLREQRFDNDLNLRYANRVSVAAVGLLPVALIAGLWWAPAWIAAAACVLVLLGLNASLYRFFLAKRGLWFTLGAIPWHGLFYGYSGLAFALGLGRHLLRRFRPGAMRRARPLSA